MTSLNTYLFLARRLTLLIKEISKIIVDQNAVLFMKTIKL